MFVLVIPVTNKWNKCIITNKATKYDPSRSGLIDLRSCVIYKISSKFDSNSSWDSWYNIKWYKFLTKLKTALFQLLVLEVSIWIRMMDVWNVKLEHTVPEVQHQIVQIVQKVKLLNRAQQVKKVIVHGVSKFHLYHNIINLVSYTTIKMR